jgi:hypothetical protein
MGDITYDAWYMLKSIGKTDTIVDNTKVLLNNSMSYSGADKTDEWTLNIPDSVVIIADKALIG